MKALQEFMMNLRDRVPAADAGMKKPVKHNVGLIRSQMLDASGKVGIADAKSRRGPKAISLHHTTNNKKLQRLFAPAWPLRQTRIKVSHDFGALSIPNYIKSFVSELVKIPQLNYFYF